jgi:uncharacterized protein (DUF305 family)
MQRYFNTKNLLILILGIIIGVLFTYNHKPEDTMSHDMSMTGTMNSMTANLENKYGRDLEKAFLTEMIPHHEGAVAMAQMIIKNPSADPEILKFAFDIINTQSKEIEMMRVWLDAGY